ncbi:MAG: MerR family transcriptional regulator [Candidatus Limnocylindrales bacterium]
MEWLPIGAASRRLGVDPDTLRRWADSGRLETFTTPGGHRRFSSAALERLASERSPTRERPSLRQGPSIGRLQNAYQRRYARPPATSLVSAMARDGTGREAFREAGQRLVDALVDAIDAGADLERAEAELRARQATLDLARLLSDRKVAVAAAIEAFIAARRPFLGEIVRIARSGRLTAAEVAELFKRATTLLDGLEITFVTTVEGAR